MMNEKTKQKARAVYFKRLVVLVTLICIALTAIISTVLADEGRFTSANLGVTNLSANWTRSTDNSEYASWTATANQKKVVGSVKYNSRCGADPVSASITFINNYSYNATLSFTITKTGTFKDGACNVDGSTTLTGNYSKVLGPGESLTASISSKDTNASTLTLSNIALTPVTYTVTANVNNGSYGSASVSATPVVPGTTVRFTAVPNEGYQFINWTNSSGVGISSALIYELTVGEENVVLTANFEPLPTTTVIFAPPVSVSGDDDGGRYSISGANINGTQTLTYDSQEITVTDLTSSTVTLTAIPKDASYAFDGWYDAQGGILSTDVSWMPTLEDIQDKTIHAQFSSNNISVLFGPTSSLFPNGYYTVNVGGVTTDGTVIPSMGMIIGGTTNGGTTTEMRVDSESIRVNGNRTDMITVEAIPNQDYELLGWLNAALEPVHYAQKFTAPLAFFEQSGEIFPYFQYTKVSVTFRDTDKGSYTAAVSGESKTTGVEIAGDPNDTVELVLTGTNEDYVFTGWVNDQGDILDTGTSWTTDMETITGYTETVHVQSGIEVRERSQTNYSISPAFTWLKTSLTLIPGENGSMTGSVAGETPETVDTQTSVTQLKTATYILNAQAASGDYIFVGWYDGNGMLLRTENPWEEEFETLADYGSITPRFQSLIVTMSVKGTAGGTTVFNNETIPVNTTRSYTLNSENTYTFIATPSDGYVFSAWLDQNGNWLSSDAEWTTAPLENRIVNAVFIDSNGLAMWQVGNNTYNDLNTAIANRGSNTKITLLNDGTLPAGTYTVPSGVTLLIPRDSEFTVETTKPSYPPDLDSDHPGRTTPSPFRTLTMASGAKLIIADGASLCVNSLVSAQSGGTNGSGSPSGPYGRIIMKNGSNIDVSGTLYAWGFITAENAAASASCGTVTIRSQGKVYECFQVADQPGGTAASALLDHDSKAFFFNKYYIQNVEVPMTLYSGAMEYAYTDFYIQGHRDATATLIGQNSGLFQLVNGTMTKTYDPLTDRTRYDIDGDAKLESVSLSIEGYAMNSQNYILPINCNMDINIHSGTTYLNKDMELHPSVRIKIDPGATGVIVGNLYLFDAEDWSTEYFGPVVKKLVGVIYSPTKSATHNASNDAMIDVNGTLQVTGKIYTTTSGADITSTDKLGKVVFQSAPGSAQALMVKPTATKKKGSTGLLGGEVTATTTISFNPCMLHNADDYTRTAGDPAGTTYYYCATHNKWETEHTLTYHFVQTTDDVETQTFEVGTPGTIKTLAEVNAAWEKNGYHFVGWNTKDDRSGEQVEIGASYTFNTNCPPADLYVQWDPNTYNLTLNPAGGTVEQTSATITYDATYGEAFGGALPVPVRTAAHANYRFEGWFTQATGGSAITSAEIVKVTEDVTIFAHWTVTYTVDFVTGEGASEVASQQVAYNERVTKPSPAPTKPHYYLGSWYSDEELTNEYDFNLRLTDALTLYAKWEPKIMPTVDNVTVTLPNLVYSGTAKAVSAAAKSGLDGFGEITVKYYNASGTEVTAANVKNAGTYTFKLVVAEGALYDEAVLEDESYTFTITKANLTVTAKPKTITYGDEPANDGVTYSGFVPGESPSNLIGSPAYDYTYTRYGDVGTYKITPKGLTSNNYNINFAQGNLTVNKKTVGLTWGNATFTYDGQSHAPTATTTGLVNSDAVTVTVTGAQTNAGTYTATASSLGGAKSGNYALPTEKTKSFTINNAAQAAPTGLEHTDETISKKHDGTITGVDATMEYSTASNGTYSAISATTLTGLEPGTYYVRYAAKTNYNASPTVSVTIAAGRKLVITWKDEDGNSTIDTTQVDYNETPTHSDPTKAATAEYTYTFNGWTPAVVPATTDTSYSATFSAVKNKYTITWNNDDDTLIDTTQVEYGTVPTHDDAGKAATAQYTYTFTGWTPTLTAVTGPATYKATYSSSVNSYTVRFLDEDGTVLQSHRLAYGTLPVYQEATPSKQGNAQYTYTFNGWDKEIVSVTGDMDYTAIYSTAVNQYTVIWKNHDGTTLETDVNVEYGTTPTYNGTTPSKEATAQYTYTFEGWSPVVSEVQGDAIYTAQFTSADRKYTVIWKNDDGDVLDTEEYLYGSTPEYKRETPEKSNPGNFSYTFMGWSPALSTVDGDKSYTAVYKQFATVTFDPNGGEGDPYYQTVETNVATMLMSNAFTGPEGKPTMIGWNTEPDGSGKTYGAHDDYITAAASVTLYAQWSDAHIADNHSQGYTISWVDGFTGDYIVEHDPLDASKVTSYEECHLDSMEKLVQPRIPSHIGYQFYQWRIVMSGETVGTVSKTETLENNSVLNQRLIGVIQVLMGTGYSNVEEITIYADFQDDTETFNVIQEFYLDGVLEKTETNTVILGQLLHVKTGAQYTKGDDTYNFVKWVYYDGTEREITSPDLIVRPTKSNSDNTIVVKAYYQSEAEEYKETPSVYVTNMYPEIVNGTKKVGITLAFSMPEGYTATQVGYYFQLCSDPPVSKTNAKTPSNSQSGNYTLHIALTTEEKLSIDIEARPFVRWTHTYENDQGETVTETGETTNEAVRGNWNGLAETQEVIIS